MIIDYEAICMRNRLALVTLSVRRFLVVKLNPSQDGFFRTETLYGPAPKAKCIGFIETTAGWKRSNETWTADEILRREG